MNRYQILDREAKTRTIAFEEGGNYYLMHEEFFQACGWKHYGRPEQVSEDYYEEVVEDLTAWLYEDIEEYVAEHDWYLIGFTFDQLRTDLEDAGFCDEDIEELFNNPYFVQEWTNIYEEAHS